MLFESIKNWATISDDDVFKVKEEFAPLVNENPADLMIGIAPSGWLKREIYDVTVFHRNGNPLGKFEVHADGKIVRPADIPVLDFSPN